MSFGKRLKQLRAEMKMNQNELATNLQVDRSTVGKWENDSSVPGQEILIELSDYFDVTLDYLLGKSDIRNPYNEEAEITDPEQAMKFLLSNKSMAKFGGLDLDKMTDDEILEMAQELLRYFKMLGLQYNAKDWEG